MKPDLIVGNPANPYLLRWTLLRWRGWQLALHKILRSDDDRALHDHVGDNWSLILKGGYYEVMSHAWERLVHRQCRMGGIYFRRAEQPHRLVLRGHKPCWTLWLRAPAKREWGFHCPRGWRHNEQYSEITGNVSVMGRGCE